MKKILETQIKNAEQYIEYYTKVKEYAQERLDAPWRIDAVNSFTEKYLTSQVSIQSLDRVLHEVYNLGKANRVEINFKN